MIIGSDGEMAEIAIRSALEVGGGGNVCHCLPSGWYLGGVCPGTVSGLVPVPYSIFFI